MTGADPSRLRRALILLDFQEDFPAEAQVRVTCSPYFQVL
jgi:hypothetical protein